MTPVFLPNADIVKDRFENFIETELLNNFDGYAGALQELR